MIDASWLLFILASLALIAVPGQDMMLVMTRAIAQGVTAGVITAAGVALGLVGHTLLATLGLGVILRTSEWLFVAIKLVGAAYLFYLGVGLLLTRRGSLAIGTVGPGRSAGCSSTARSPTCPTRKSPFSISRSCRNSCRRRRRIRR